MKVGLPPRGAILNARSFFARTLAGERDKLAQRSHDESTRVVESPLATPLEVSDEAHTRNRSPEKYA